MVPLKEHLFGQMNERERCENHCSCIDQTNLSTISIHHPLVVLLKSINHHCHTTSILHLKTNWWQSQRQREHQGSAINMFSFKLEVSSYTRLAHSAGTRRAEWEICAQPAANSLIQDHFVVLSFAYVNDKWFGSLHHCKISAARTQRYMYSHLYPTVFS